MNLEWNVMRSQYKTNNNNDNNTKQNEIKTMTTPANNKALQSHHTDAEAMLIYIIMVCVRATFLPMPARKCAGYHIQKYIRNEKLRYCVVFECDVPGANHNNFHFTNCKLLGNMHSGYYCYVRRNAFPLGHIIFTLRFSLSPVCKNNFSSCIRCCCCWLLFFCIIVTSFCVCISVQRTMTVFAQFKYLYTHCARLCFCDSCLMCIASSSYTHLLYVYASAMP